MGASEGDAVVTVVCEQRDEMACCCSGNNEQPAQAVVVMEGRSAEEAWQQLCRRGGVLAV